MVVIYICILLINDRFCDFHNFRPPFTLFEGLRKAFNVQHMAHTCIYSVIYVIFKNLNDVTKENNNKSRWFLTKKIWILCFSLIALIIISLAEWSWKPVKWVHWGNLVQMYCIHAQVRIAWGFRCWMGQ